MNWDSRLLFDNEKKIDLLIKWWEKKRQRIIKKKKRKKRVKEKKPNFQKLSGWFWNAGEV